MRVKALVSAITFSLLFALLFVIQALPIKGGETMAEAMVVHAGYSPAENASSARSLETWENFQPSGWVGTTPVTCTVEVYNPGGFTEDAEYEFTTGGTWSSWMAEGLQRTWLDPTRRRLTVSNLAFPHSLTENQNQIKFRYKAATGGWLESGAYSVRVDTIAPTSAVTLLPCYPSAMEITGTASDSGSGVAAVQITLQRASDGLYYNGSSWELTARWITVSGTTNWSLPFAPGAEMTYLVTSRAIDNVGRVQSPYGTGSFAHDVGLPDSVVLTAGYFSTWPGFIQGSASDSTSGVASVQVVIQRASDGWYYNGTSWDPTLSWVTATGTNLWTVSFAPTVETTYTVTSRATDNCGNLESIPSVGVFIYDATSPTSAVATTGCTYLWEGLIEGTASDTLSGVASVRVALQRASDGFFYSGSSWGPTITWITASGTTAWSLPFVPTVETVYTVTSRATDRCGNEQSVPGTGVFTYDVTQPHSAITTTGCVDSSPGMIGGTANDAVSGVANVRINLQRASDGLYYDGASWVAGLTWIDVAGTSSWSLPFTAIVQSLYTVTSSAVDRCGNVQGTLGVMTFSHDLNPPSSSIATTGYYSSSTGAIVGTAYDEVSGIAQVEVRLQRASDSLYYDGSSWTASSYWIPASLTSAPAAASAAFGRGKVPTAGWAISTWAVTGWTVGWALPFMPTVQTTYTVESRATDRCGNPQAVPSLATFLYDSAAPLPPANLAVQPSLWTPVNAFTVTWTNPPDLSGIATAHYKWDSAPTSNTDESPGSPVAGDGIQSLSGLAVPAEGAHQLYLWLGDKAGDTDYRNRNATGAGAFKWDATSPTTNVIMVTGRQVCSGWFVSAVTVSLQATDVNPNPLIATSGISATFWRTNGNAWQQVVGPSFVITDQGVHVVDYYSVDVAGNVETYKTITPTIKIDTVPPTTSPPSFTGTLGPNGWYRSAVSVTLSAVDATSGISVTYHQLDAGPIEAGGSFSIVTDGAHTIRYYSVDAACNQENSYTATLKIDKTYPNTLHQLDGRPGDNGWFLASPVTVTLSASDLIPGVQTSSGVDKLFYRIGVVSWVQVTGTTASFTVAVPTGQKEYSRTVEYYATDLAGNIEPTHAVTVGMDFQAPSALPFGPYALPGGWTNVNCFDIRWYQNPADFSGIGGAYYSFQLPISNTGGTLFLGDDLHAIPCVQVPTALGDGLHNVYIWLRDKAGNSDYRTRHSVTVALDRIPPQVGLTVAGNSCGTTGWYNSAITVTCAATDTLSGMASGVISHRVNRGDWITGTTYSESQDGRYEVECRATDGAGNPSEVITRVVRLDRTPPDAPTVTGVEPSDWSNSRVFTVRWVNPDDFSGLGGVYYKQGSPPGSSTDGTYVDGFQTSLSISATATCSVPVYIWLVDKACNSDYQQRAMATLKYDSIPPTTTFSAVGTLGNNGWYTSPVSITLTCVDSCSGCAPGGSRYRIGDGPWRDGNSFLVDADSTTTISYYSLDLAGNSESPHTDTIKIDRTPPSSYAYHDGYSPSTSFTIRWEGSDAVSGIETFDVQYKVGTGGPWTALLSGVPSSQMSRLFNGAAGKVYYFRTRATDKAGNVEPYPAVADTYVSVDLLVNGDFERDLGGEWATKAVCSVTQAYARSYSGGNTRVVVLGCPDQKNDAPIGESMICQTINMPPAQDMPAPRMQFRYHIFTYDVVWGEFYKRFYDSFHAGLSNPSQMSPTYVFTDGNWTQIADQLWDLGWRQGSIDLRPYTGQTIRVCLANVTRVDAWFNTWTLVDDVRIVNMERKIALPIAQGLRPVQVSAAAAEAADAAQSDSKGETANR